MRTLQNLTRLPVEYLEDYEGVEVPRLERGHNKHEDSRPLTTKPKLKKARKIERIRRKRGQKLNG